MSNKQDKFVYISYGNFVSSCPPPSSFFSLYNVYFMPCMTSNCICKKNMDEVDLSGMHHHGVSAIEETKADNDELYGHET